MSSEDDDFVVTPTYPPADVEVFGKLKRVQSNIDAGHEGISICALIELLAYIWHYEKKNVLTDDQTAAINKILQKTTYDEEEPVIIELMYGSELSFDTRDFLVNHNQEQYLCYKELDGINTLITNRINEGVQWIVDHFARGNHRVYLDTESAGLRDRYVDGSEREWALITLFDAASRSALLWRVHDMSYDDFRHLKEYLDDMSMHKEFVVYGRNTLIRRRRDVLDLQQNQESLREAARKIGISLKKTETFSDWTRGTLRRDQQQYALMDAVILHHIHVHREAQSLRPDKTVPPLPISYQEYTAEIRRLNQRVQQLEEQLQAANMQL